MAVEAFRDPRARPGLSLLFDARQSVNPMSFDDVTWRLDMLRELTAKGRLARLALLLGPHQSLTAVAAGSMRAEVPELQFAVFDNAPEANEWLRSRPT